MSISGLVTMEFDEIFIYGGSGDVCDIPCVFINLFDSCTWCFFKEELEASTLVFQTTMEAIFTLRTSKLLCAFWGPVSKCRLKNMFRFKDALLIRSV